MGVLQVHHHGLRQPIGGFHRLAQLPEGNPQVDRRVNLDVAGLPLFLGPAGLDDLREDIQCLVHFAQVHQDDALPIPGQIAGRIRPDSCLGLFERSSVLLVLAQANGFLQGRRAGRTTGPELIPGIGRPGRPVQKKAHANEKHSTHGSMTSRSTSKTMAVPEPLISIPREALRRKAPRPRECDMAKTLTS